MSLASQPPIRLALVITELEVGGAEQALVNLATGLTRERFSPVVYSLAPRPENDLLVRRLEEAKIPVHFLNLRSRWQFFTAVSRLARLLRQQQPQVMQSFLFHANVVGTMAARRAKVPRVIAGIRVADPSHWRQRVERWLAPRMDKIVCVSQSVADFCRDRCRFPAEKLVVIPNGVDLARFENIQPDDLTEVGVPAGHRAILYAGRLDRQKGLDWLLTAVMPRVFRELTQHDLVLLGDGPQRRELEAVAASTGIGARVHFAGWRPDVPNVMMASDVLVLPSQWEGMPNVVLEAMASRLPIVATQAEGIVELLGDLAAEQTCAAGDAAGFAERVIQLAQDSALASRLKTGNYARARTHFSLTAMVAAYESLYESLSRC